MLRIKIQNTYIISIHVPLSHPCEKSSKWSTRLLKLESWTIPLGPFRGIEGMLWALKDLQHGKRTNWTSHMWSPRTDSFDVQGKLCGWIKKWICDPSLSMMSVTARPDQNLITYFLSNKFDEAYNMGRLYVGQKHIIVLELDPRWSPIWRKPPVDRPRELKDITTISLHFCVGCGGWKSRWTEGCIDLRHPEIGKISDFERVTYVSTEILTYHTVVTFARASLLVSTQMRSLVFVNYDPWHNWEMNVHASFDNSNLGCDDSNLKSHHGCHAAVEGGWHSLHAQRGNSASVRSGLILVRSQAVIRVNIC